jgi:hypothetical protein
MRPTGGPSVHVATDDAHAITFLKSFGATGTTISETLSWVSGQSDYYVQTGATTASIVTSGLVLHMDANTYSGTGTWNDLTANAFTATRQGTVPFTSAGDLSYFTFNGGANYLLGNSGLGSVVNGTSGVTVSTVFKMSNTTQPSILFSNLNGSGYAFECGTQPSNLWVKTLRSFIASNTSTDRRGSTQVLTNNVIYLMTMTWDQINKVTTLYINGSSISSNESSSPASLNTSWATPAGASFQIGAMTYYSQYGNGSMYKMMVYNRALTSGEVTTNYDAIKTRFGI